MKILILGSGGREHALAWKLGESHLVAVAPGNAGIARSGIECLPANLKDTKDLIEKAKNWGANLIVVGPEDPLIEGVADELRNEGFPVFGAGKAAAQLEGSKAFSKEMMREAGVPTADFATFISPNEALDYVRLKFADGVPVVVKASGNALGKGVVVCSNLAEAEDAVQAMLVEGVFGEAGAQVVIEDRLVGYEFSLMSIVSDGKFLSLPVARDYKRALDGDRGPNTGGMGTYCSPNWPAQSVVEDAEAKVVEPIVKLLQKRGISYRGVLFSGLMVQSGRVFCLEYNVRFGDPETQSIMRVLGDGLADLLLQAAVGENLLPIRRLDGASCTVVVASEGYPGDIQKGIRVEVNALKDGVIPFFAGVSEKEGGLVNSGGRVLGVSAVGETVQEARKAAYEGARSVQFQGAFMRSDIALDAE